MANATPVLYFHDAYEPAGRQRQMRGCLGHRVNASKGVGMG